MAILLVEDERLVAISEKQIIERHGYCVVLAQTGEQALQMVDRRDDIGLVLMDIDLGDGIDGTETAERILRQHDLPIVFLTSHQEQEVVERTRDLTSYGYVVKNSGEFVLIESIRMATSLFAAHAKSSGSEAQLRALFDTAEAAIIALDRDGRVVTANRSACEIVGRQGLEVEGMLIDAIYPEHAEVVKQVVRACLREQMPMEFSFEATVRPETTRRYQCRCIPVDQAVQKTPCVQIHLAEVPDNVEPSGSTPLDSLLPAITRNAPGFLFRLVRQPSGDYEFTYVSEGIARHFGYSAKQVIEDPATLINAVSESDRKKVGDALKSSARAGEQLSATVRLFSADGRENWVKAQASVRNLEDGAVAWTGICIDVTDETVAVNALRSNEEQLRIAVQEQEFLVREMNHRIKNNLAMVHSLLGLKQATSNPPVDLSDVANRIDAIRQLHDLMHRSESAKQIDVRTYIQNIVDTALSALGADAVVREIDIEPVLISPDAALPLALIVNEIATNAVKHGFPQAKEKRFTLNFRKAGDTYELSVSNTGPPLPANITQSDHGGIGIRLIQVLSEQISGELDITTCRDPVFSVRFPVEQSGKLRTPTRD